MIFAIKVSLNQMVQKDGSTTDVGGAGAGSGGGSINIFYYTNTSSSTTINVEGGTGGTRPSNAPQARCSGGDGGSGTVTKGSIASGSFVKQ